MQIILRNWDQGNLNVSHFADGYRFCCLLFIFPSLAFPWKVQYQQREKPREEQPRSLLPLQTSHSLWAGRSHPTFSREPPELPAERLRSLLSSLPRPVLPRHAPQGLRREPTEHRLQIAYLRYLPSEQNSQQTHWGRGDVTIPKDPKSRYAWNRAIFKSSEVLLPAWARKIIYRMRGDFQAESISWIIISYAVIIPQ